MFEKKEGSNGSELNEELGWLRKDVVWVLEWEEEGIKVMMDWVGLNKWKENGDGK